MDFLLGNDLYIHGANFAAYFQTKYASLESMWIFISNLADPRYSYTIYFPLMYGLTFIGGVKVLWLGALAEWLNILLKWALRGERPYWWVGESSIPDLPALRQFPQTCETGPGNPSGHVMVTAAVWILVVNYSYLLLHKVLKMGYGFQRRLYITMWLGYVAIILLTCGSRVYIATHFPHQCLLGFVVGIVMGLLFDSCTTTMNVSRKHCIMISVFMMVVCFTLFYSAKAMGLDPNWSVQHAIKWCQKRDWIRLDTTPLFTVMRTSGAILGVGLACNSKLYQRTKLYYFSSTMRVGIILSCLFAGQGYEYLLSVSKNNHLFVFYATAFVLTAGFVYVCVSFVPYAATVMFRALPKGKFLKR